MYRFFKTIAFLLPPERAHAVSMALLEAAAAFGPSRWALRRSFCFESPFLERSSMSLRFKNPVGLAAGFDKNGQHIEALSMLGFGFIEVGTVTPLAQGGNPKPRLFRLPTDRALINRMGFNNEGLNALARRLERWRQRGSPGGAIVGGNIGKNKTTPNETAESDYLKCFERLFGLVDYFTINVSSPNTPGLRELQDREPLTKLLLTLQKQNAATGAPKPILLKIAPDLTESQLRDIVGIVQQTGIAGVVATNTTVERSGLHLSDKEIEAIGNGGLSGPPVRAKSTEIVRFLRKNLGSKAVIVAAGGIESPETALEKLAAGADMLQLYTGLIYAGPNLPSRICRALAQNEAN